MKKRNLIFIAIVVLSLLGIFYLKASGSEPISEEPPTTTVYDFTVIDNQGNEVSLSQYRGKVLLIVNTATRCGHTPSMKSCSSFIPSTKIRDLRFWIFHATSLQSRHQSRMKRFRISAR